MTLPPLEPRSNTLDAIDFRGASAAEQPGSDEPTTKDRKA